MRILNGVFVCKIQVILLSLFVLFFIKLSTVVIFVLFLVSVLMGQEVVYVMKSGVYRLVTWHSVKVLLLVDDISEQIVIGDCAFCCICSFRESLCHS